MGDSVADQLNASCRCITVDRDALAERLEARADTAGLYASICANQPNLFATLPVFVSRAHVEAMRAVVEAVERALAVAEVRDVLLAAAPEIARIDHGPRGVFLGYDFHLGPDGPRLIEINTNAGGALLNAALGAAQKACCDEVDLLMSSMLASGSPGLDAFEDEVVAMFRSEWRLARGDAALARIAIVDDEPEAQYLHPEFLLFRRLFERAGLAAVVADPRALRHAHGRLWLGDAPIDLVYNRLTDFALTTDASAALRAAYVANDVVVTPHPRAHALYADKRNLALLGDAARLRALGVDADTARTLEAGIPRTELVDPADGDAWWARRKQWFFKPVDGYGGKAAYRGDKLTRGAWQQVLERPYVAQSIVPPSERTIEVGGALRQLKLDLRNYVYDGRVQLVAARLYQGQTTNFRTTGGGFAPVFTEAT
ncbi:hypothetical protein K2Z84_34220 [Candidatus Binatia bacterium]|nr:hypothetical protein [Candidatus Binatia bacterium]